MTHLPSLALSFACLLIISVVAGHASNRIFHPGDCFFPFDVSETDIEKLKSSEDFIFKWSNSSLGGIKFCGYHGIRNVKLQDVPPEVWANFTQEIQSLLLKRREQTFPDYSHENFEEVRLIRVLLYHEEYPVDNFPLGRAFPDGINLQALSELERNRLSTVPGPITVPALEVLEQLDEVKGLNQVDARPVLLNGKSVKFLLLLNNPNREEMPYIGDYSNHSPGVSLIEVSEQVKRFDFLLVFSLLSVFIDNICKCASGSCDI